MLGLTIPQAAATLAATVVGFNIGLFDQSVVNAVLVLILVSIVVATLTVDRVKAGVPSAGQQGPRYRQARAGSSRGIPARHRSDLPIGASIAGPDGRDRPWPAAVALPRPSEPVSLS